jgi:Protein of unknown function (DUF3016)
MRSALYAGCAIGLLVGGLGCATQGTGGGGAVASAVVTVQYTNPQSFTDFRVQGRDVQSSTSVFTRDVTQTLEPVMGSQFPGYRLTLRFTNIDLAGQRTTAPRSVRVVSTRHPARLSFNYVLQDKSGKVAASGSQTLVQTSRTRGPSGSGTVNAETQMLQRWLRGLSVNR